MNTLEKLSLSWKDFKKNASESFCALRNEEDFFDVTLVCDDMKQIEAHKVVLSSCSPVLKYLLKSNKHPHPLLYIRGVKNIELQNVIDYIYFGEVSIAQEDLNGFLVIAEDLKLKGLINTTPATEYEEKPTFQNMPSTGPTGPVDMYDQQISSGPFENLLTPLDEVAEQFEEDTGEEFNDTSENVDYSNNDYETVINSMMEKVNKLWHCKVCGKEYTIKNKTNLKKHVENNHARGFIHTCGLCGKTFSTKSTLLYHRSICKRDVNASYL